MDENQVNVRLIDVDDEVDLLFLTGILDVLPISLTFNRIPLCHGASIIFANNSRNVIRISNHTTVVVCKRHRASAVSDDRRIVFVADDVQYISPDDPVVYQEALTNRDEVMNIIPSMNITQFSSLGGALDASYRNQRVKLVAVFVPLIPYQYTGRTSGAMGRNSFILNGDEGVNLAAAAQKGYNGLDHISGHMFRDMKSSRPSLRIEWKPYGPWSRQLWIRLSDGKTAGKRLKSVSNAVHDIASLIEMMLQQHAEINCGPSEWKIGTDGIGLEDLFLHSVTTVPGSASFEVSLFVRREVAEDA
ncbi:hypothetical protein WOLCODRAFT_14526 [Wolfiporia cocos MD-104 SS10]|uniref:Uncharacterized protein n=1 Tax=Wolfiporia cocos (strain MD-104) TaxID=742152 RepID=A0A2H3IZZ7_WOLCO|nr:hypothetical protein WOLCODRAFT_14526 [Wolfiporia cocos MD-104 SS10]